MLMLMKKILFLVAAVAIVFVACDRAADSDRQIDIHATIGQAVATKAPLLNDDGSGYFEKNDAFALFVKKSTATNLFINNRRYLVNGVNDPLYWDDFNVRTLAFSAYYPRVANVDPEAYMFDLAAFAPTAYYFLRDLLVANATLTHPNRSVELVFKHVLHKVVVNLVSGSDSNGDYYTYDQLAGAVVNLTAKHKAKVNILEGTAVAEGNTTVDARAISGLSNPETRTHQHVFIVAPQTVSVSGDDANPVSLKITVGDVVYRYNLPDGTDMAQGYQLNINITLNKTSIDVVAEEIQPWNMADALNGTPEVVFPE